MATNDSTTTIPDPGPEPRAGSPAFGSSTLPPTRLLYWSVLREFWEHRWIYIVPLIVAAVFLFGFVIGAARVPLMQMGGSRPVPPMRLPEGASNFASGVLMLTYLVVAAIYCLGALHGERSDRSILFWKSLPVSDVTTVIAKASLPLVLLPLITFAITVGTQVIMLLAGSVVMLARGADAAALWSRTPLLSMWVALLYHLFTVHAIYYAPFYGWLLLVSGWARRATFLWAVLPVLAIIVLEKLVLGTMVFAHMLVSRLAGGPTAVPFPPPGHMNMAPPTLANLGAFLASPGLWLGLAVFAAFLVAAVWLRRRQGPI
ncbi:MAG: ABC transporter permease [Gammaproteobacteria bacterium]|nr:ABC transporter permease [Gammaproteobacteria bacterium]